MSRNNTQICRCCLKILRKTESRLQTNKKNSEIFKKFIGYSLLPGIICGKCNINLLTFDAFQTEVKRKHDEIGSNVVIKEEKETAMAFFAEPMNGDEMIEAVLMEDDEMEENEDVMADANLLVEAVLAAEPKSPENPIPERENPSNSDDEDEVICVPQEPQVPIDLDALSDEPQPKPKEPDQIIFKCDHCTAVSDKKEVIVRHIRQSHNFKCETCGKVYPSEERLKSHDMRTHKVVGNRRKQSMNTVRNTEEHMKFRLKSKPYGRPWPSRFAKGEYND